MANNESKIISGHNAESSETEYLQTPYGIFAGAERVTRYPDGSVSDIFLREKNVLMTHAGDLVPFYLTETPRRKYKSSVSFYPGGMVKSVYLEEQQEVTTPIGPLPAEFVTFYKTGELKRVFILDGKLSGFWSETDERTLNIPLNFEFSFGSFSAMLVGLCFYKSGEIRSVTLFPGESIELEAYGFGKIPVRNGFSLYEDGSLESLEPVGPVPVLTPIGNIYAYDPNATGINADSNSLKFGKDGSIREVITNSDKLFITGPNIPISIFSPAENKITVAKASESEDKNAEDDVITETIPLRITFDKSAGTVTVKGETEGTFSLSADRFQIMHENGSFSGCTPEMCKSCSGCPSKM